MTIARAISRGAERRVNLQKSYVRPEIAAMSGYVPGEQPQTADYIKLNTNENPYPPSPRVVEAIREAAHGDILRKYPDPLGWRFRKTAGEVLGVDPDSILIGNGSDDILTIVTRAFVPSGGKVVSPHPSYLLYETLAQIQGARFVTVPFEVDWSLPTPWPEADAHLTFLPNPNSPTGTAVGTDACRTLAEQLDGVLVIDEAYVDFAEAHALALTALPNVLVTRSLSKSYSLAGIRFGFGIGRPELVRELYKVKDSYNCDAISLAAATAAIADQEYLRSTLARIRATRERLQSELQVLGFDVVPSQANFVWCTRREPTPRHLFEQLKSRRILVRYMNYEGFGDGLRITVGTDDEIDRLLEELRHLV